MQTKIWITFYISNGVIYYFQVGNSRVLHKLTQILYDNSNIKSGVSKIVELTYELSAF